MHFNNNALGALASVLLSCIVSLGGLSTTSATEITTDYSTAYKQARREGKSLLIWFTNDTRTANDQQFQTLLTKEQTAPLLKDYVVVAIPKSAAVEIDGKSVKLLEHRSFAEMLRQPGLAIIDLANQNSPHYGNLVSVYPYRGGQPMDEGRLQIFLTLPPGTITQRALIFAVRTHRDRPQSTRGVLDPMLSFEAAKHSAHQANITLQGHHQWNQRFQLISAKLPRLLLAQEVCAESWPGQGLVESADECVHCWRQSSGHWSAVSANQPRYGYDMKRGRNGVWYATGIFGHR